MKFVEVRWVDNCKKEISRLYLYHLLLEDHHRPLNKAFLGQKLAHTTTISAFMITTQQGEKYEL